ncbi:hypothetical protein ACFLZZ_03750 [Nanoarchaeota archaeon]
MANGKKRSLDLIIRDFNSTLVSWTSKLIPYEEREKILHKFHSQEDDSTFCEVFRRYDKDSKTEEKLIEDAKDQFALARSSTDIMLMHKANDTLEQLRIQQGWDKKRKDLIEILKEEISFEKGLEKTLEFLNKNREAKKKLAKLGIARAETLADVAKVMPEISAAEIAWISTINSFPKTYLSNSKVPTILDFNVDGIDFGFDGLNAFELQRENSYDPFEAAGFTGMNKGVEFKGYKKKFGKAFKALAFLVLSDSFIYSRLYEQNGSKGLTKGEGKLKRAFVEKDMKEYEISKEELENSRLADLPGFRKHSSKLVEKVNKALSEKNIFDLGKSKFCSNKDLITIVGLLEKVPETFTKDGKFKGYILPFGKGVKILDSNGVSVEYVAYDGYVQALAQESLHYESTSISRSNNLANMLFSTYAQEVETQVSREIGLPLDELKKKFKDKYDIQMSTRAIKSLKEDDDGNPIKEGDNAILHSFGATKGDNRSFNYSLKVGLLEGKAILDTLDKLPRDLVPEITSIKREFGNMESDLMFMGGYFKAGQFVVDTKEIVLLSPEDKTYRQYSPLEKQIFLNTLTHEVGHAIFHEFEESKIEGWKNVSKIDKDKYDEEGKKAFVYDINNLIRAYTPKEFKDFLPEEKQDRRIDLVEEDFCEHFSAYVNHGLEFREKMKESKDLEKKYLFLKGLFEEKVKEGEQSEYKSNTLASLKEIYKHRDKLEEKRSLEEALLIQQQHSVLRERESRELRERVFPSLEVITGTAGDRELQKHIYGQENKEHSYLLRELNGFLPMYADIRDIDHQELHVLLNQNGDGPKGATGYLLKQVPDLNESDTYEFLEGVRDDFRRIREDEKSESYLLKDIK